MAARGASRVGSSLPSSQEFCCWPRLRSPHGPSSGVDTEFFVDHEDPLSALAWLREQEVWPLGDLPDGQEFVLLFESMRHRRSRWLSRRPEEAENRETS